MKKEITTYHCRIEIHFLVWSESKIENCNFFFLVEIPFKLLYKI